MVAEASVVGLFKMLLIIIGALVVVRFYGQLVNAKRNIAEEKDMNASKKQFDKEKKRKTSNLGKTSILGKSGTKGSDVEDVDFEEID